MAFSLNKIMLIGNLGQDAETSFTPSNLAITKFNLATTHRYKGKDGNWVDETTWHNVVAFNLSQYYQDNLKRGKKFYIEGRLSKRDYTDKEGVKRYFTEVVSEKLIPLDGRENATYSPDSSPSGGYNREPLDNNTNQEDDDLPF